MRRRLWLRALRTFVIRFAPNTRRRLFEQDHLPSQVERYRATILREPALGNIHACQNFDTGCDCGKHNLRRGVHFIKDPVDTKPQVSRTLFRLKQDITGRAADRHRRY